MTETKDIAGIIPPKVEWVRAYLAEIGYTELEPEAFMDFYEAKGWRIGRANVMVKNWQAALRNWKRHRWGLVENKSGFFKPTNASLGALQLQLQKVKDEIQQLRNPSGSAYPAAIPPGPKLDRLRALFELKALIEKRIEGSV